jgi:two-component system phosphate regulon response regulator OmpR
VVASRLPVKRVQSGSVMLRSGIKVLLVDDEAKIRELLERFLMEQGFSVAVATNTGAAERLLSTRPFDLMVLDLMLPGESGLAFCKRLRNDGNHLPIIMLTAKVDEIDRVVGLEVGADDYVSKPFSPRELVARIHAVLRRQTAPPPRGAPQDEEQVIKFGEFVFNLSTRELRKADTRLRLTTGEFSVLQALTTHPRKPLSRNQLLELARGREYTSSDRSMDVQISRIRSLIEEDPTNPRYLQTVHGFGYVFVPDGKLT